MGCDISCSCRRGWVFPGSTLVTRKQEFSRVAGGCVCDLPTHQSKKQSWIHNTERSQMKIVWCLVGSGSCTNEHVCAVHVGRFICLWFFDSAASHSLPLSSPSGKIFVWGFQKQDVGPTFNMGQLPSIKLTLSLFSSHYRRASRASCLFLLFHFRCRMDISLSDGSILSKGLETALLRPFEKLQTLLLFSLSLI